MVDPGRVAFSSWAKHKIYLADSFRPSPKLAQGIKEIRNNAHTKMKVCLISKWRSEGEDGKTFARDVAFRVTPISDGHSGF